MLSNLKPIYHCAFLLFFATALIAKDSQLKTEQFSGCHPNNGSGQLGVIIERASGSVVIVTREGNNILCRVEGLGDLSHASMVFSPSERYAYVFGRDGGLSQIDILNGRLVNRVIQSGNAIGGAISQDGRWVAVSNYTPGGVKIFDAKTLKQVDSIAAMTKDFPQGSKVVGLTDGPNNQLVFSLYDAGEIWLADLNGLPKQHAKLTKFSHIGSLPYDGLLSPNGRTYIAGLFGEQGMAKVDLWNIQDGVKRILPDYGKGEETLPIYKMPHLEGWTFAGERAFFPAVGEHQVLVANTSTWLLDKKIPMKGQPVFVMARPDARNIWVNFAFPDNQWLQVIDTKTEAVIQTIEVGPGVMHLQFTPRGEQVWVSVRDLNQVKIYDSRTFQLLKVLEVKAPSGIFFTNRAHELGL
ncbi:MAG: protein nirF [Gammaproteobacteria bacterium CG22_combo_CG10-13_8_21_14_all_40_8]|nr:MAG: protein nirF [Gammaproteobacteria bacterium CG22_combo_CG10-13_8_21_14_all_40_8]